MGYTELAIHFVRVISDIRTKHFKNTVSCKVVPRV